MSHDGLSGAVWKTSLADTFRADGVGGTRELSPKVGDGLICQAAAGPWEEATAAYERGDYQRTLKLMRLLAEQSDGTAQYNLGLMYYNG